MDILAALASLFLALMLGWFSSGVKISIGYISNILMRDERHKKCLNNSFPTNKTYPDITTILSMARNPLETTNCIDNYSAADYLKDKQNITYYSFTILFIGCGYFLCHYLIVLMMHRSAQNQVNRMRQQFVASSLRQDIAWFDATTSRDFASKITK